MAVLISELTEIPGLKTYVVLTLQVRQFVSLDGITSEEYLPGQYNLVGPKKLFVQYPSDCYVVSSATPVLYQPISSVTSSRRPVTRNRGGNVGLAVLGSSGFPAANINYIAWLADLALVPAPTQITQAAWLAFFTKVYDYLWAFKEDVPLPKYSLEGFYFGFTGGGLLTVTGPSYEACVNVSGLIQVAFWFTGNQINKVMIAYKLSLERSAGNLMNYQFDETWDFSAGTYSVLQTRLINGPANFTRADLYGNVYADFVY